MNYSKALSVVRAARGLEQRDIANILGKSPSYISKIEKNIRPMTDEMIEKLCDELKIPKQLFLLLGQDSDVLDKEDSNTIDKLSHALLKMIVEDK